MEDRHSKVDERGLRLWHGKLSVWEQLHHLYVALALIGLAANFWASPTVKEAILLMAVAGYVVVVAAFAATSSYINGKKARYAEISSHIHTGMHCLRDLRVLMRSSQFKEAPEGERILKREIGKTLDSFRACMEIVVGAHVECRVELLQGPRETRTLDNLSTYPIARDAGSATRRRHMDEDARARPHPVASTSAYMSLYRGNRGSYYFCGDVHKQQDFTSEYFDRHPNEPRAKSVVIWPIRYRWQGVISENGQRRTEELVGFLHAESMAARAFTRRYDVELGAAFADSMFDVIFAFVRATEELLHAKVSA